MKLMGKDFDNPFGLKLKNGKKKMLTKSKKKYVYINMKIIWK